MKLCKNINDIILVRIFLIKWKVLNQIFVNFLPYNLVINLNKNKTHIKEKNYFKNQMKIYKNLKKIKVKLNLIIIIIDRINNQVWKLKKKIYQIKSLNFLKKKKILSL